MFFAFLLYETQKSNDFHVLKIDSPTEIVVDLNKNGICDKNEVITLKDIQSFSTKQSVAQAALARQIKITNEDALGLGFLAENFAKETLINRKVKLEKPTCLNTPNVMLNLFQHRKGAQLCDPETSSGRHEEFTIISNGKNYENLLLNKGFAVKNDEKSTLALQKNIEKVHKLNLCIFNNKSHKYHKLNCKYGLMAHNSQILPISQLPKDAKSCKFCHLSKKCVKCKMQKVKVEEIPDVKSPPTVFKTSHIKLFLTDFTRILKPSNSCDTAVCQAVVQEINSAKNSIDFAIYGYTKIPKLQQALEKAQQRGVKIRFVYDTDRNNNNIYPDTLYLTQIIKNNFTDHLPPIMHDKFFIFDNRYVITGSANISNTDMSGFNSNAVILIDSEKMANIYEQEFEQMYRGKFNKSKSKFKNKEIQIGNTNFQVYFSPEDKGLNAIIPLIDSSQKYIYIPAFLITHKGLAVSLINASKRGVSVKIILDATNTHTSSSKLKLLRQNGIQVKTENIAGKLHSKSIIIDDIYTIIGSMNFSRSGETSNDENLLVIKNREIALFYKTFFQYLWKRIPDKWLKYNARAESTDSIGSCSDGIDNDFDGKIDKADESCKMKKVKSKK